MISLRHSRNPGHLSPSLTSLVYDLPAPVNLSSLWNFGSLLGLCLGVQLLSGLFLSMHYNPSSETAFEAVSLIMRDVWGGWLLRYTHANVASFFFFCLYLHIGRGIYFGSYLLSSVWFVGVTLLLLLMAASFLGYVLPWGQISFWGATVITNLLSAIPYFGPDLVFWVWGGFAVDSPTLNRFYSLHFLLPWLVAFFAMLHIWYLHSTGSSNPLGVSSSPDKIPFHCYYCYKDVFGFTVLLSLLLLVIILQPQYFLEPVNLIPANPIVTPQHIVPEWYFLFAYCILRSVPQKLGGVIAMASSLLLLVLLPLLPCSQAKSLAFYGPCKLFFWCLVTSFCLLTVGGSWPVEIPYTGVCSACSLFYFSSFPLLWLSKLVWDRILWA